MTAPTLDFKRECAVRRQAQGFALFGRVTVMRRGRWKLRGRFGAGLVVDVGRAITVFIEVSTLCIHMGLNVGLVWSRRICFADTHST